MMGDEPGSSAGRTEEAAVVMAGRTRLQQQATRLNKLVFGWTRIEPL